ncbi:MAG: Replication factor C large subunit [Methanosaeta sp. PtaB.Bin039]|nr:MAG: Replication factor C large subunit [Methanosaeta sp. PtaB.Bin039]
MQSRWVEKYRPSRLDDILGNDKAISLLRSWAAAWQSGSPEQRAAILYGPAGVGKTSAALALAQEMDWDAIEMNASDQRTATAIGAVVGPASQAKTFSGRRRLIVIDEADNLHGTYDRGGAAAILRLVRETAQPILLIANEYYAMEKPLRDACLAIQFRSIRATTVALALREICRAENLECQPEALMSISESAGGDLRSAINDLQAAAEGLSRLTVEDVATGERDVKASIFRVLDGIFRGSSATSALKSSYDLDESPEDLVHWIDENLPAVYKGPDLYRGFESLSRADIFLGRVRIRQNYGMWRYASFFMTGGISAAKSGRKGGYVAFKPPSLWRRLGQTRKARNVRDSAAKKIGRHCHVGVGYARTELSEFISRLLRDKGMGPRVAALLDLNAEEIALLIESSPTTRKVQSIFEEAELLKESERLLEIRKGLGEAVKSPPDQEDGASGEAKGTDDPKADTSAPDDADKGADCQRAEKPAQPVRKRRGRPPKAESEKAREGQQQDQKQQKSLFEF